jgi:methyltransferase
MVSTRAMGYGLLALVALERVAELAVSSRNARRVLARGGVEAGRGHYPAMVSFHALVLAACAAEPLLFPAPWPAAAAIAATLAVFLAQALRWWAIWALGERWSTRIVVVPGSAPVERGPYRFLRHPNYLAVALELAALPLALGAWRTAIAATLGNALLLAVRIPAEERALGSRWAAVFSRPRGAQARSLPNLRWLGLRPRPSVKEGAPPPPLAPGRER